MGGVLNNFTIDVLKVPCGEGNDSSKKIFVALASVPLIGSFVTAGKSGKRTWLLLYFNQQKGSN